MLKNSFEKDLNHLFEAGIFFITKLPEYLLFSSYYVSKFLFGVNE